MVNYKSYFLFIFKCIIFFLTLYIYIYIGLKRDPMLHGSDEPSHRLWGFYSERIDINAENFKNRKNFGKLTFEKGN